MTIETPNLLDALNSVTAIPVIPFNGDGVDYAGHAKNVDYLMANNSLDGGRPRVIALAGTSLIHHVDRDDQLRLMDETGQQMGGEGILMSGIVPNPIGDAGKLLAAQASLKRPPDVYLLMPISGVHSPDGIYDQYMRFAEFYGKEYGARFLYYFRNKNDREILIKLIKESPHFVGVKIGTDESDVEPIIEGVGNSGIVMWGIGDRSTRAAELGAKGHTSGIAVFSAGASDALNNAQRKGDYKASRRVEAAISALEEIRFRDGRMYNYSAVVEAMNLSGFDDIVGGNGGPFNPPIPPDVSEEVKAAIEPLMEYH
jgi:dihydrodipicolinate synthase/N-acetylneuraminate lyase